MSEIFNKMHNTVPVSSINSLDKKTETSTTTIPKTDIKQADDEFVKEQEKSINKRRGWIA